MELTLALRNYFHSNKRLLHLNECFVQILLTKTSFHFHLEPPQNFIAVGCSEMKFLCDYQVAASGGAKRLGFAMARVADYNVQSGGGGLWQI